MNESTLPDALRYLKALADESRLRIVGILASGERTVEELAAMLELKPPTVSHHLHLLKEVELVSCRAEGTARWYQLEPRSLTRLGKLLASPANVRELAIDEDADAWERKVLRDFFDGERLKEIPASRKKRQVVLNWLAGRFRHGKTYTEAQVNERIKRHHPDCATLRRELIVTKLMSREDGRYWRTPPPP